MSFCIYAISKKIPQSKKKKSLFDLRCFLPIAGRREEGEDEKTKKEQYTHRANSNFPGESIVRERGRVLFLQTGENHPSFTKSNTINRKAKREA